MKALKYIVFIMLLLNASAVVSQNNKVPINPTIKNPPPQCHFSWYNACYGDTTCFVNQSILANTYTWTVMEDTLAPPFYLFVQIDTLKKSANDSIFCFYFNHIGTYRIMLVAYDNHWDTLIQSITIDSISQLSFYYFGCRDAFVNNSSCFTSFHWDFGDGHISNDISPIYQYADTGHYQVTLIGYNGIISDTLTQQVNITSVGYPNPAFTYTVSHDTVFVHAVESHPNNLYNWTFHDNSTHNYETGQDTFHVYKDSTATYIVSLYVVNGVCGPAIPGANDTISISQQPPPLPAFSFVNTCLGDTTCFINQTIGGITYTWTVHDSGSYHSLYTSTNASNVCYRFPAVGNYSVTLITSNPYYTESVTQVVTIGTIPLANFSFIHCSNNFINNSSCSSSFYWDFGDGTSSTLAIPNHQYADTGYYQVTLIAVNSGNSNTLTQQIHVDVVSSPTASYTYHSSNDTLWAQANYVGIPAATYNWTFGDGGHATGKNAMHIYADTVKTYDVKLEVNNVCGAIFNTDTIKITVPLPPSDLDFSNSILTIVPNPVSNNGYVDAFFNAYAPANYLTQIYNAIGQKVFEEYFSFEGGINEFKISAANFSSGVYIMVMQAGNSYIRKKFYVINTP